MSHAPAKAAAVKVKLYLQSGSDFTIRTEDHRVVPLDTARQLWQAGMVADYNSAFFKLVRNDFDLDATRRYYLNDWQGH